MVTRPVAAGRTIRPAADPWRPRRRWWIGPATAVVAGCLLAVAAQWPVAPARPALAVVDGLVGVLLLLTGALLGVEDDQRGNGRLFVLAGVAWAGVGLENWGSPSLKLAGWLSSGLFAFVALTVLLRYPEQRLRHRYERLFVIAAFVWVEAAALAIAATKGIPIRGSAPTLLFGGLASRRTGSLIETAGWAGLVVISLIFVGMLGVRLVRAKGLQRRTLTPVLIAAIAAGVAMGVRRAAIVLTDAHVLGTLLQLIEPLALIAVPGGFLVAALQRRLARAAVADMVLTLTRPGGGGDVLLALRTALHDPSLRILYWVDDEAGYLRADGTPDDAGSTADDRLSIPIAASSGDRLALVRMDATLTRHASIVEAALSAAVLALENARLQAGIRAQLAEVRASRSRIVEAGLAERRRLEQNLHDGAQQRLLALSMQLAGLRSAVADAEAGRLIDDASATLRDATRELRELAHGLHPAILTQMGLGAALESVAGRFPLPVLLAVPASRWPEAAELTAYFVACEAITNAVKHAEATHVSVTVTDENGDLLVRVSDDGVGGAHRPGHGLTGIRDRVAAAGGTWSLVSPPGEGTTVTVALPMAGFPSRDGGPAPRRGIGPANETDFRTDTSWEDR
ncbi:two-component sensor histidine kinase [Actinoplanes philippinensis]|uniref:histidine kinase n=1 Tax=Actinoplanes philippinensis TaxID=35752 RepID=A0A1I2MCZ8_9ACTN|nr:sensor histidine kinase [Actinoplanes philippinensis]GIE76339.1 two-component sensor histidine kinase [Actinoplanes philippinensis]SFF89322.1 Histidine kinase-, DNA gyrase B-, and HSP90-like ATPase [Actinoplanes philippinensis]